MEENDGGELRDSECASTTKRVDKAQEGGKTGGRGFQSEIQGEFSDSG